MKIGVTFACWLTNETLWDLAIQSLDSITSDEHELVFQAWLNHGVEPEQRAILERYGQVRDNDENCLSRAWNRGINDLLEQGCDYVFCPNLDIKVMKGGLDALVRGAESRRDIWLWTMSTWADRDTIDEAVTHDHWMPYPHFSAFMIDRRCFEGIGPFDEAFKPAYNEDLDYHWRIHLAGHEAAHYEGARFHHVGSVTLAQDLALAQANEWSHYRNNIYFTQKWRQKPDTCCDGDYSGLFRVPFDDPAKIGFEREYARTW